MNVVCIVADDLNAWIGALGTNPDVRTPNLDRLAAQSALFARAYCPAPYCNASRVATFTGRLPSTSGVYANEPYWERPGRSPTIVELLRRGGYHTVGAGKVFHGGFRYGAGSPDADDRVPWNDKENRLEVWDRFVVNRPDVLHPDRPVNGMRRAPDLGGVGPRFDWGPLADEDEAEMPDGLVVDTAAGFLGRPDAEPFLCAAGLYKPHLPWYVPQRYFDLYDRATLSLPPVKLDDLDDVPPLAKEWALARPNHRMVVEARQWRPAVHAYLAAISYCDARIGEIVDAVDRSPAAADTAVILFGDNGFHLGEKLHWRKFALWEEATRVPLVIRLPGVEPVTVHDPVSLVDIFPTMLELAGLPADPGADGASLLPHVHGAADRDASRPAVMTWGRGNHSVRSASWRYTRYADGTDELYDQRTDPHEWTNLAARPRYEGTRKELAETLPDDAVAGQARRSSSAGDQKPGSGVTLPPVA